ncbi:MAG: hypothetical protein GY862_16280 [Gammaproteobacteria bacterium]|nr:hypothetical protein [Gammaproteobacteria bacterium]
MTEHMDIQNPEDYSDEDFMDFEEKLFSFTTPVAELEKICMTLAHLPVKRAQDILRKFGESGRAKEVEWLECAQEEGEYHYLSPENEQEERDYLALKVVQEITDETIELEMKYDEFRLELDKLEIEHEAVKELIKNGDIDEEAEYGFPDNETFLNSKMEELEKQIVVKEKTVEQIKKSITTEKYKDMSMEHMRHVHFT